MAFSVLGIVPARGGSKGVPRKNIRPLGDRPLLAFTVDAARAAQRLTRVVLSTEDEEIASVGRELGLEVPFMRPRSLAEDTTPTLAVVRHVLSELRRNDELYDAVCLLQPTSPFRADHQIDACIELLVDTGCDAVVTVVPVPAEHNPHWVWLESSSGDLNLATGEQEPIPRRQDLPAAWCREGSVYVTRVAAIEAGSLYGQRVRGFPIEPSATVNIDTPDDWSRAEEMLRTNR